MFFSTLAEERVEGASAEIDWRITSISRAKNYMFVWSQIAISSIICRCMLPRFIHIHSPLTLTKFDLVDNEGSSSCHYLDIWEKKVPRHGVSSHTSYSRREILKK